MSSRVLKIQDVDVSKIKLGDLKKSNFGKYMNIKYGNSPCWILFPHMNSLGAKAWPAENGQEERLSISFSFEGKDAEDKRGKLLKQAYEKVHQIEEHIRNLIVERKSEIFPLERSKNPDVIKSKYTSMLKQSIDKITNEPRPYAESIKCKIVRSKEDPSKLVGVYNSPLQVCDKDYKPIDINAGNVESALSRNSVIIPVIDLSMLFIDGKGTSCSITNKFVQGMMISKGQAQGSSNNFFIKLDEEDEEMTPAESTTAVPAPAAAEAVASAPAQVVEEEEEEESEEEEEDVVLKA